MLVVDLIEKLKTMDPTAVVYYQDDEGFHPGNVVITAEASTLKTVDHAWSCLLSEHCHSNLGE